MTGQRRQRINNVEQAAEEEQDYEGAAAAALNATEQDNDSLDSDDLLKFLEEGPAYRSLSEGWRENYENSNRYWGGKELCEAPIHCEYHTWLQ